MSILDGTKPKPTPLISDFIHCSHLPGRRVFPDDWASRRLYSGERGGANWLRISKEPAYPLRRKNDLDLGAHYARALDALEGNGATVLVSLGPGDGEHDLDLIGAMSSRGESPAYIPVDLSIVLLQRCVDLISQQTHIAAAVLCDFEEELSLLSFGLMACERRPTVFSLLGGTIGNLDRGEREFIVRIKELMQPGDALLLDVPLAGSAWTAEDEPRLRYDAYTLGFRSFVCEGLKTASDDCLREESVDQFEAQIGLELIYEGIVPETKTVRLFESATGRRILDLRRYSWQQFLPWLEDQGLRVQYAGKSFLPSAAFGMGVILVQRKM